MNYATFSSHLGNILVWGTSQALRGVSFGDELVEPQWVSGGDCVQEAQNQINEFLAGKRTIFELPTFSKGTLFQENVWRELRRIPYGEVISYGELARRIGSPRAVRAVGTAVGANPLPIIIPCHRVIRGNGEMGMYSGGVEIKQKLLAIEGVRF